MQQRNYLISPENDTNLNKYVLRVYLDLGYGEMRHEREHEVMTWIRERGHTFCPHVAYYDWNRSVIPYRFMVQEYISGEPISKRGYVPGYVNEEVLTKLATLLKTIHKVHRDPSTATEADKKLFHQEQLMANGFEYAKLISEDFHKLSMDIWNRIKQMTEPYLEFFSNLKRDRLVHGDCHFHNLIDRGDQFYLVDWELCCTGHPLEDIGTFIATTLSLSPEQESFLLKSCGFEDNTENNITLFLYKIRRITFLVGYLGLTVNDYHTGRRTHNETGVIDYYKMLIASCGAVLERSPIKT